MASDWIGAVVLKNPIADSLIIRKLLETEMSMVISQITKKDFGMVRRVNPICLDEATRVGYGFALPASNNVSVVPNVPKLHQNSAVEIAA
jgi:hypothetical protein